MTRDSSADFTFLFSSRQRVSVGFDGPDLVADTGLLTLRDLDCRLGFLEDLASRLPDPRAPEFVIHTTQNILVQQVYQLLAACADCNDADVLRDDSLFRTLVGRDPDDPRPLASGSTLARFQYAFTRRQLELPLEERPAFLEMYQARSHRLNIINQFLVDTFIRTRRQPPAVVILDLDPTDDPTHGRQALSGYHGYYQQHQYFPLLVFDGDSGFPLAAWLRPGTAHGALGAVAILASIVSTLRQAWPNVLLLVRGDSGLAVPAVYEFCEAQGLLYAFGYASNAVLQRRTAAAFNLVEIAYFFFSESEPHLQRFQTIEDYQAEDWSRPRRILCKLECTPQGSQRRYVVTNLSGDPGGLYRGFYVQRGEVPEQPLGELKNGLDAGRLSAHSFRANAYRLLLHVVAYALVVLFREAASELPEVCCATVSTLRTRLWKVGATVTRGLGELCFHVSATWPGRELWCRVQNAVLSFVAALPSRDTVPRVGLLGMSCQV